MASLNEVTAPLTVRFPDGEVRVIAHHFPHPEGRVVFELYWHLADPDESIYVITGEQKGDGPWKIGECVFNVLGCHGTNHELATAYEKWLEFLQHAGTDYPPQPLIEAIARRYGAVTESVVQQNHSLSGES